MRGALTICPILMAAAAVAARESDLDQPLPLEPARQISIDTNEGTWLSPDIAPDGATIVFELLGDLFSVDARGGAAHALTTGMAFDSQPVFSPDGRDIAFLSDRSGAENVWLIAADGSNPRQLTTRDDNSVFASPAWSADPDVPACAAFSASATVIRRLSSDVSNAPRSASAMIFTRCASAAVVGEGLPVPTTARAAGADPHEERPGHTARTSFERVGRLSVGRWRIPLLCPPHR